MKISEIVTAIIDRLGDNGIVVVDNDPVSTPPAPAFVVLYYQAGLLRQDRYDGKSALFRFPFTLIPVANSATGTSDLIDAVRDLITDWRPSTDDRVSPCQEVDAGPIQREAPSIFEQRYSAALDYVMTTPRSRT